MRSQTLIICIKSMGNFQLELGLLNQFIYQFSRLQEMPHQKPGIQCQIHTFNHMNGILSLK